MRRIERMSGRNRKSRTFFMPKVYQPQGVIWRPSLRVRECKGRKWFEHGPRIQSHDERTPGVCGPIESAMKANVDDIEAI